MNADAILCLAKVQLASWLTSLIGSQIETDEIELWPSDFNIVLKTGTILPTLPHRIMCSFTAITKAKGAAEQAALRGKGGGCDARGEAGGLG